MTRAVAENDGARNLVPLFLCVAFPGFDKACALGLWTESLQLHAAQTVLAKALLGLVGGLDLGRRSTSTDDVTQYVDPDGGTHGSIIEPPTASRQ